MKKRRSDKGRSALFILTIFIAVIVLMACGAKDTSVRGKDKTVENNTGFREIHIVGEITPEPIEHIDFDLDKLAITGRDDKNEGRKTSEYQSEDLGDTGADASMPEGIGEYDTGDGARPESNDPTAVIGEEMPDGYEPFPDGDTEGNNGYANGEQDLSELLESGDDEARLQGSVDEHAGLSEDGYGDGQPDESEVGEQSIEGNPDVYSNEQYGNDEYGEDADDGRSDGDTDNPVLTYLGSYTATAYCACSICTGVYSTGYTASGTLATEGRTIACNTLPFGTQVYIEGYGYYTVEDTGWSPYGDAWIDLYFDSHDSAIAFGVRNVEVYLVN